MGKHIQPECLVLVETTVPPGTCEKVVKPILEEEFTKRGIDINPPLIAHSYERVMPIMWLLFVISGVFFPVLTLKV